MMIRVLLTFLAIVAAVPALAQSTRLVRSGEHPTYSRLVIPMGPGQVWELRTIGRRTEFIVPGWEGEFDYSTVFDRIPKTRILSLKSQAKDGDTRLSLSLGCACDVKASISGQYVVIDVLQKETDFAEVDEEVGSGGSGQENAAATPAAPSTEAPAPTQSAQQPSAQNAGMTMASRPESAPRDPQAETENAATETPENNPIADRLIAQLEAAARQGIVELQKEPEPEPTPEPPKPPEPEPEGLGPEQRDIDSLDDVAARIQQQMNDTLEGSAGSVRVTAPKGKISERNDEQKQEPMAEKEPEKQCLPPESLNAHQWVDDDPIVEQLTALRNNLIGEFDKPDPYAVRDLARFYIAIGFGAEALALLEDLDLDLEDRDMLIEMAEAAEGAPHKPGGVFHQGAGCHEQTALWRTIIVDQGEDQPVQYADQIVNEFAKLPLELRRRFGPRLVQSFLSREQYADAQEAFDVLDRAAGAHGDGHEMMRARLFEMDGAIDEAESIYVDLYVSNAENAPQALIRLANLYLRTGRPLPEEMMNDLESEATKYRYEDVGPELRLIEIRAKAGSLQMSDALDVVTAQMGRDPEINSAYLAAADQILGLTNAADLGAGTYATTIFSHSELVVNPEIRPETQVHVAKELVGIGLPRSALDILVRPIELGTESADLTEATAHMAMDNPDAALSALKGNSADHNVVRGRALASLGRHDDAFQAVQGAASPGDTAMYAWRAGEWQSAVAAEAAPIRDFARFMVARQLGDTRPAALPGDPPSPEAESSFAQAPDVPEEASLAEAGAMVSQSEGARQLISDALDAF